MSFQAPLILAALVLVPVAALPAAAAARPGESTARSVYAAASPAVVSVRAGGSGGQGTGFLIDAQGTIVTNAHVVGDSRRAQVSFGKDRMIDAEILGTDPSTDLAVLKVDASRVRGVRPLALADSDKVVVGDPAVAIGNPFGLDRTATEGIISALGRQITAPNGFGIDDAIQTDAPINPGNSGGPLLNAASQVVGVNSQILTGGSGNGNVGVGFAVPSNTVREVVPRLVRGETISRPYLGLSTAEGPSGATVAEVVPGGPAARAGLRVGDVVVRMDGGRVGEPADVAAAIADRKPRDRIDVEIRRGGRTVEITVELGTRPARTP